MVGRRSVLFGVGLVVVLVVVGGVFAGLSGDAVGSSTSVSGDGFLSGVGSLLPLATADTCNDDLGYDNCIDNYNVYERADGEVGLRYDNLPSEGLLGYDNGVRVYEPGSEIRYRCGHDGWLDFEGKRWLKHHDGDADLFLNSDTVKAQYTNIDESGGLEIDWTSARHVSIVCATHAYNDGYYLYTAVWVNYGDEVRRAVDSDGDGVYDVNDDCPNDDGGAYRVDDSGCPLEPEAEAQVSFFEALLG